MVDKGTCTDCTGTFFLKIFLRFFSEGGQKSDTKYAYNTIMENIIVKSERHRGDKN